MPGKAKKQPSRPMEGWSKADIDAELSRYAKDPYFVKKAENARKTIERVGLPKQFFNDHGKKTNRE